MSEIVNSVDLRRGIRYSVNKEKRRVVAILDCCSVDCIERVCRAQLHQNEKLTLPLSEALVMNDTYVGVAKCSPEDEWDEELGRKIALERCLTKYNRDEKRRLELAIHELEVLMNSHQMALSKIKGRKYQ